MSAAQQDLHIMARAFAQAMGRNYAERATYDMPIGTWYIERADTQLPLYRLAERLDHGAVTHPITSVALSARELADALYFARLAVGFDRQERKS